MAFTFYVRHFVYKARKPCSAHTSSRARTDERLLDKDKFRKAFRCLCDEECLGRQFSYELVINIDP